MGRQMKLRTDQHTVAATYPNRLRSRIKTTKILTKLQQVALGKEEMTATQFNAAKLLLNKTLPDAVAPKAELDGNVKDITHVPTWKLIEAVDAEVIE